MRAPAPRHQGHSAPRITHLRGHGAAAIAASMGLHDRVVEPPLPSTTATAFYFWGVCALEGGSLRKHRITGASVVATAVPTTPDAPAAPSPIIVHGAVWISRFNRRAVGAHPGVMRTDGVVCHRGPEQRNRQDCGGSNEFEIDHRVSPSGLENAIDQSWWRTDVPTLVPKRNFQNAIGSSVGLRSRVNSKAVFELSAPHRHIT